MADRKAILLFISGNPGLISYYRSFFETLHAQVGGLDIVCKDFVGFEGSDIRGPADRVDLHAQIAHQLDLFDGILMGRTASEKKSKIPIFVAGHSVGAYIALKVLEQRSEEVQRIYLLTPALSDLDRSRKGRVMKPFLEIPGMIGLTTNLVWLLKATLPKSVLHRVVKLVSQLPDDAVEITTSEVLRPSTIYSTLTLAKSEFVTINAPDVEFWKRYATRCSAYWASNDEWVSDHHRTALLAIAEGMESYHCKISPHAFCIRHGDVVGEKVGEWIRRDILAIRS